MRSYWHLFGLLALVMDPPAPLAQVRVLTSPNVFVSDRGDDARDGSSLSEAVRTPERGLELIRKVRTAARSVYLDGQFTLSAPIRLDGRDAGLTIAAVPGGAAELLALNAREAIVISEAHSATIHGLTIRGFAADGILVRNARDVHIKGNTVVETRSNGWSQGAIHLTGTVAGAIVTGNTVRGADYAGIIVDTDTWSDVSGIQISYNRVTQACRVVHDCGAIYVNDRGRRSTRILITRNVVHDFGGHEIGGRALYLDDWVSNVIVSANTISGPGRFAIQIHGGHNNRFDRNLIDLDSIDSPLIYQAAAEHGWCAMSHNVLAYNVFTSNKRDRLKAISIGSIPCDAGPVLLGNRLCRGTHCSLLTR